MISLPCITGPLMQSTIAFQITRNLILKNRITRNSKTFTFMFLCKKNFFGSSLEKDTEQINLN